MSPMKKRTATKRAAPKPASKRAATTVVDKTRDTAYTDTASAVSLAQRTLDARPDRLDFRDLEFRAPLRSLPPHFPTPADLANILPKYIKAGLILDQGREGACTGFGLACVINHLRFRDHLRAAPKRTYEPVSPRMLYELARKYDEWPGEAYQGSSCRGALKGWHKHGVCGEGFWPYPFDATGTPTFVEPTDGWDADALQRTLGVYYRVDKKSVVDMQAAILNIGALYVSANVHAGWGQVAAMAAGKSPKSHADVPDIPLTTTPTGGHAFALVGYDERGFIVQNSWGTRWAASGFARLLYADWVANGTDAWACALGVPMASTPIRVAQARWRTSGSHSLTSVAATHASPRNHAEDPWPIDRAFLHRAYEPVSTATAYAHTIVTGNDGEIVVRDITRGGTDGGLRYAKDVLHDRPLAWLSKRPAGTVKLAIYAHGGLNDEESSIQRVRVLAPYFLANDIYPLFLTWRTGPGETVSSMVEDWVHRIPGFDPDRAGGIGDAISDIRDRALEPVARMLGRGIWTEMRENAQRSTDMDARHPRGLDALVDHLAALSTTLKAAGRPLQVHLLGHSAGSILLGHFLSHARRVGAPARAYSVGSCTLHAAACSVPFALTHYVAADADMLPLKRLHLAYLDNANEQRDALPSPSLPLYGKSLLYLVSRALDDVRKMPLLGMECSHLPKYANDDMQWERASLPAIKAWQKAWLGSDGDKRTRVVTTPAVRQTREGDQVQSTHGSFDNNIDLLTEALQRMRGSKLVAPMEWLDY